MIDHALASLLGLGIPACLIFVGSAVLFAKTKTAPAFLQLVGAGGLVTVVVAHIAEAFDFLPWMGWGIEQSAGHYLDLSGAVLGLTSFPMGYLLYALTSRRS